MIKFNDKDLEEQVEEMFSQWNHTKNFKVI